METYQMKMKQQSLTLAILQVSHICRRWQMWGC